MRSAAEGSSRAEIVHVDLSTPPLPRPTGHALYWIVFWSGDMPLGHAEIAAEPDHVLDLAAIAAATGVVAAATHAPVAAGTGSTAGTTLVICTRDRPDALERCLASLPDQTLRPDQVVVVDNASIDERTREVAERAGVTYVREDRPGLDIARNRGALAATGQIVAYTDDDVVLHPRWLERMVAAFDDGIDAVTGLVLPGELETSAQLHFERYWGFGKGYRRIDFGEAFFAADRRLGCPAWEVGAGASMAFRATVFSDIGLFDPRLDVGAAGCSGDSEYWHRLLSHGRTCRYEPAAVAFHFHRRDLAGLRKQLRAYMRGHSAALLVQFERSRNFGNLRRLMWVVPVFLSRQMMRQWIKPDERTRFATPELAGFVAGIVFYLRTTIRRGRP